MQVQTRGEFGGLGIEVTLENGYIKVVSPIDDTPAARAGVKAGDLITTLDGKTVQGLTLNEAVEQDARRRRHRIKLTIRREGATGRSRSRCTREVIRIQVVASRLEGDDIGYVRLTSFNEQTDAGLRKAIDELKQQARRRAEGIVLDLRNNPGGLLDQAVAVSDDFLEQGEIVSTRARQAGGSAALERQARRHRPRPAAGGADQRRLGLGLRDRRRRAAGPSPRDRPRHAQSFGKGSVQTVMPIQGNGAIRLTTARYFTPSGRSIQATGIEPDIEVLAQRQEAAALHPARARGRPAPRAAQRGRRAAAGRRRHPASRPARRHRRRRPNRLPPEGAPAFDATKPETDFQLQQATQLLRNLAAVQTPSRRAAAR